jgi:hypothetical protein
VKFTIPRSAFGAVGIIPALALHPWFSAPVSRLNSIPAQRFGFAAHDFLRVRSARPVFGSRGQVSQFLMKILVRTPASGLCLVHEPKCTPVDFSLLVSAPVPAPRFLFCHQFVSPPQQCYRSQAPQPALSAQTCRLKFSFFGFLCSCSGLHRVCSPVNLLDFVLRPTRPRQCLFVDSACSWSLCGLSHA